MTSLISNLFMRHRKHIFRFVLCDFVGKSMNDPVDDQVGHDLLSELGVFIVQEVGGIENRILILDTDNDVTPEQIMHVFRKHGVTARYLEHEED